MSAKEINTKEKILSVAHELFSQKGFDGVSVRDICSTAQVNISAVNYHFKNKFGLYTETMNWSIGQLVETLEQIHQDFPDIEIPDYVGRMFDCFTANKAHFRSTYKFFLSMSEIIQEIEIDCIDEGLPPGGRILREKLLKFKPDLNEEDLGWAIRSISSQTFHNSLVSCNHSLLKQQEKFGITEDRFKLDIMRTTKLILNELS